MHVREYAAGVARAGVMRGYTPHDWILQQ